jgi:GTPase
VVDVLPVDGSEPIDNYRTVERELERYAAEVHAKPRLIALNKVDLAIPELMEELRRNFEPEGQVFPISAVTGEGLEPLLYAMVELVKSAPSPQDEPVRVTLGRREQEKGFEVVAETGGFRVEGKSVERLVAMTDLESDEALRYLHRKLSRMGVLEKLRELGAEDGDTVAIGEVELTFQEEG